MKKILSVMSAVALLGCAAVAFAACSSGRESSSSVRLEEVDSDAVGRVNGVDYYLVPEPAATAKCKALTAAGSAYYNVASLQSLYGENGYPQAVLVAKSSLIENDGEFVKAYLKECAGTSQWLSEQTDYAPIVANISKAGGATLKAPMLSAQVIENCNINYVPAMGEKQNVLDYMNSVRSVNAQSYGECADAFFCDTENISSSKDESKTTVSVVMPDGAPALSMAKMMAYSTEFSKTVSYKVVAPAAINSQVTASDENANADLCVMPVNTAAKLLGNGQKYKLLGTVTHGNLFIISSQKEEITSQNLKEALGGKRMGVVSLNAVPGLTLKMVLDKYSLPYEQENK